MAPRAQTEATRLAARRHLGDPIDTLTDRITDGVSKGLSRAEVEAKSPPARTQTKSRVPRISEVILRATVETALREVLTSDDASGRGLRMDLIAMLASVGREALMEEAIESPEIVRLHRAPTARPSDDPLLSTADAAEILGFSRTYVAMLIDNDRIPGAIHSEGGHRRVPKSAVLRYQAAREAEKANKSTDYRAAAQAAGMYSVSDRDLVKMARRPSSGPLRKPVAKKTKQK